MTRTILLLLVTTASLGCNPSEHHNQLESANERINDLQKLLAERDSMIQKLEEEIKTTTGRQSQAHNQQLLAMNELHAKQIADLETKNAELQLSLGTSEKHRLALKALLDQPKRLASVHAENNSMERVIWLTMCLGLLGIAGLLGTKYFTLRSKRRDDLVKAIGNLSHQI